MHFTHLYSNVDRLATYIFIKWIDRCNIFHNAVAIGYQSDILFYSYHKASLLQVIHFYQYPFNAIEISHPYTYGCKVLLHIDAIIIGKQHFSINNELFLIYQF